MYERHVFAAALRDDDGCFPARAVGMSRESATPGRLAAGVAAVALAAYAILCVFVWPDDTWRPEWERPSALGVARLLSGRDIAGALERLDLHRDVVLHHMPRHVHQRVAEIDVDAHTGHTGVVVVLQTRLLFGIVDG